MAKRKSTREAESITKKARKPGTYRQLTPQELWIVRKRTEELLTAYGSQSAVGRVLSVSQQTIGKVLGGAVCSYHYAGQLAKHDRLSISLFLSGVPRPLHAVMTRHADRWTRPTVAAVVEYSISHPALRANSEDDWISVLDRINALLRPELHPPR